MKRTVILLLSALLLTMMSGCREEPAETVEYALPEFVSGTLQTDRIQAEPGNYDRIQQTGNGRFIETESGYYDNPMLLMYADKSNMDHWVCVCPNPDCRHSACIAAFAGSVIQYRNDRIYFLENVINFPEFNLGNRNGIALLSMSKNGEDVRLEHFYETKMSEGGGCISGGFFGNRYRLSGYSLLPDGTYRKQIYLIDPETDEVTVLYDQTSEEKPTPDGGNALDVISLYGDPAIVSCLITNDRAAWLDHIYCLENRELIHYDITPYNAEGGYLHSGVLRFFQPGEGYYDADLTTGTVTKLAEAQLEGSAARILQPNCIIETTLLSEENTSGPHRMRFFDGEQWHEVTLPEELQNASGLAFAVIGLGSESILLRTWPADQFYAFVPNTFYQIPLGEKEYRVEYLGTYEQNLDGYFAN